MLFVVRFFDNPQRLHVRQSCSAAHLAWLQENSRMVLVAGSLREHPEDAPKGALWIVDAGSPDEVDALIRSDPYWVQGLRNDYELLYWSKAFDGVQVPV